MTKYLCIKNDDRLEQVLFDLSRYFMRDKHAAKDKSEGIVVGCKEICTALNISSRADNHDANRKRLYRLSRKYNLPVHHKNRRMFMYKKDIHLINEFYLLGIGNIARYFGIHVKTFKKWLKRFPKMPVDRKKEIAFMPELNHWFATLIYDRINRGRSSNKSLKKDAPITASVLFTLAKVKYLRIPPRELKRYMRFEKEKILN